MSLQKLKKNFDRIGKLIYIITFGRSILLLEMYVYWNVSEVSAVSLFQTCKCSKLYISLTIVSNFNEN